MNTATDLRAALHQLAAGAPTVEALDHSAWRGAVPTRHRRVLATLAVAAVVLLVAVIAAISTTTRGHHGQPAGPAPVLEVRPLIARAVAVDKSGQLAADPLRSLGFPVPQTEAEFGRLSTAQQTKLLAALTLTDCAAQHATDAPVRVACSNGLVMLLGPAIVDSTQLSGARPVQTTVTSEGGAWSVSMTFNGAGRRLLAQYTTAHHVGPIPPDTARLFYLGGVTRVCRAPILPCADVLAFLVSGSARSVSPAVAPITDASIEFAGTFTHSQAVELARQLHS